MSTKFNIYDRLQKRIEKLEEKARKAGKPIKGQFIGKVYKRSATITISMIDHFVEVHNGKTFKKVFINSNMVGDKLGEYSPTRSLGKHGKAGTRSGR